MNKQELASQYHDRFPTTPNRTLSRLMHKEQKSAFPSVDSARSALRIIRGAKGDEARKLNVSGARIMPLGWQKNVMPKSESRPRRPLLISGPQKIVVMSDLHIPYHDDVAVQAAVNHALEIKPDTIILNGDIGDFYAISRHDKDPRRVLADELDAIRQFLYWLRGCFPDARIIYKIGNHEDRMERFLVKNAPVLLGVSDFEIPVLLRFDELKIEHVPSLQLIRAGKLPIYHGHELPQGISSPVNPARGMFMRVGESLMCGHWHRVSEHTESTGLNKKYITTWSLGCLCNLSPDYCITNRWGHGMAFVEVKADGNYIVRNHQIIAGKVY